MATSALRVWRVLLSYGMGSEAFRCGLEGEEERKALLQKFLFSHCISQSLSSAPTKPCGMYYQTCAVHFCFFSHTAMKALSPLKIGRLLVHEYCLVILQTS